MFISVVESVSLEQIQKNVENYQLINLNDITNEKQSLLLRKHRSLMQYHVTNSLEH